MLKITWVCAGLVLVSCNTLPESYPPPEQRKFPALEAPPLGSWVRMNEADAGKYIVNGVSEGLEANTWRWTFKRPELRFFLADTQNLRFTMEFTIAEVTFRETGPVTLSFFINGKLLDKVRYQRPGRYRYDKAVDPSMLVAGSVNHVAIEPDKVWISRTDGVALGFILISAGFIS